MKKESVFRKVRRVTAVVIALVLCLGMVQPVAAKEKVTLKLSGKKVISIGRTTKIKATLQGTKSPIKKTSYKSSKTSVATVNSSGTVKGKKQGSSTITVTVTTKAGQTVKASIKITVEKDYVGSIDAPRQPKADSYRISNNKNPKEEILVYVKNIDKGNFKFRLTKATRDKSGKVKESLIFKEHIAHYNGKGYYEFKGKDYHLYFKYDEGKGQVIGDYSLSVYGLNKLFSNKKYSDPVSYKGIGGNKFIWGLPFTG